MSDIKQLSSHLKVLKIFGLQCFSIQFLNFKSKKLKFASKNYLIYFLTFPLVDMILSSYFTYENFAGYSFESEEYLGLIFRILGHFASIFRLYAEFCESLFKIKQNQNFFMVFEEFCEFILLEFRLKTRVKFLKRFLIRRTILTFSFSIFVVLVFYFAEKDFAALNFAYFRYFALFIDFMLETLIIFKFCFYVDLICVCLRNLKDIFEQISLYMYNKELLLNKVYKIKRSYIYIVEMTKSLNNFMSMTIFCLQLSQMMWLLETIYFMICVLSRDVDYSFVVVLSK